MASSRLGARPAEQSCDRQQRWVKRAPISAARRGPTAREIHVAGVEVGDAVRVHAVACEPERRCAEQRARTRAERRSGSEPERSLQPDACASLLPGLRFSSEKANGRGSREPRPSPLRRRSVIRRPTVGLPALRRDRTRFAPRPCTSTPSNGVSAAEPNAGEPEGGHRPRRRSTGLRAPVVVPASDAVKSGTVKS